VPRGGVPRSRREVRGLMRLSAGWKVSRGSVQACCEATSGAMVTTHAGLHAEVKTANSAHADETGFGRCGELRIWLWAATSGLTEVFRLLPGRGRDQAKDLLGEGFAGILHRDRWKPYEHLSNARSQLCHAHLRRHFQAMLEGSGETATQGAMMKLASDRAFHHWHRFEQGEIDRIELIRRMAPIQKEMRQRLTTLRDHPATQKKACGIAKDLLRQWDSMWTYVHFDEAVPTNNEAERIFTTDSERILLQDQN